MLRSKRTLSEEQVSALEQHLAGTLQRVVPPTEVVQRLRDRLRFPQRNEIVLRIQDWQRMWFVLGGVMSGMIALITVARAFYYFFGRKHM
jgi:hypothetical protein